MSQQDQQLEAEYFHLTNLIDSFDQKSLTIKAWSVTLAGILAGSGAFFDRPGMLWVGVFGSLMFWLVEGHWKAFQAAHYARIEKIEAHFRGEVDEIAPFQSAISWEKSRRAGGTRELIRILGLRHVFLPHGLMAVALVVAGLLL
ncbi:MAG: hypothetical protein ACPH3N_05920 [Alcanivorax sediminis]|uniref:Uncharacterized protein n=1 Tax=Alcanivorax sediminis TaxID=2663008 RepID=A0A6N7LW60_9GAMM|nr:hypothetical protein [Alcanivorax sediminis]MQX53616.1 hypothetical protein [Alcanivorax sediminis]